MSSTCSTHSELQPLLALMGFRLIDKHVAGYKVKERWVYSPAYHIGAQASAEGDWPALTVDWCKGVFMDRYLCGIDGRTVENFVSPDRVWRWVKKQPYPS